MKKILRVIPAGVLMAGAALAQDATVIVYNANLGLIQKTIELDLRQGTQTVCYTGVPSRIDPASVRLGTQNNAVRILEQNFRYDTVNLQQALRDYINREITIYLKGGVLIQGTLISADGDPMLRIDGGKYAAVRLENIERIEFPRPESEPVNQPSLFWTLSSDRPGKIPASLSYLSEGLSWRAEYSAEINADETAIDLSALASIENRSGERLENVRLRLLAGEINRAPSVQPLAKLGRGAAPREAMAQDYAESFAERGIFEYHIYDLQGMTTLDDSAVKQIALFAPRTIPVQRQYHFNPNRYRNDVMTILKFTNSQKSGETAPLPAGRARIYKQDRISPALIGEDTIDHVPAGGEARLAVGRAFELSGERRVMATRSVSSRINEQDVEIVLKNRKSERAAVIATESLPGVWEITVSSLKYERKDANTIEFNAPVPANGETAIRYTVRFTYQ